MALIVLRCGRVAFAGALVDGVGADPTNDIGIWADTSGFVELVSRKSAVPAAWLVEVLREMLAYGYFKQDVRRHVYHCGNARGGSAGIGLHSEDLAFELYTVPEPAQWRSVRTHGGAGQLSIILDPTAASNGPTGPTVENRNGGIQRIEVDYNMPVAITNPGLITVVGRTTSGGVMGPPISYTPASVMIVSANTIAILFNAAPTSRRT